MERNGWKMSGKLIAAIAVAVILVLGGMVWPEMAMVAWASYNGVSYREASWNESTNTVSYTNKTADNVTGVVSASEEAVTWTGGWYVVNTDATITNRIKVDGNVNLILADGKTLTASNGIAVPSNNSLTIYGQEAGTGKLISNPTNDTNVAAIGRDKEYGNSGNITIHDGHITTANYDNSFIYGGIGGNNYTSCTITIYGGNITAFANNGGGISAGPSGTVNIYGGTVAATDNGNGAGIGGASDQGCGTIRITGGTITARSKANGSGIGTGDSGKGGTISITGGNINAGCRSGAAIGSGHGNGIDSTYSSYVDGITISGAAVTAKEYDNNGNYLEFPGICCHYTSSP